MVDSRVTKLLNIQYPVIQAAMTWLTSAEFVAAVSQAGGLGVLGPNAGQKEKARNAIDAAEKMREQIQKVRVLTNKPFAVNYLLPIKGNDTTFRYAEPILNVLCEENVDAVIAVSYGEESEHSSIEKLKHAGIKVIYREISPTVKNSVKAQGLGVDALIITGHEAGGYLSQHRISTLTLLPQVTDVVSLPVIAAGGVFDAKTARAAFSMGAEGVYMGTRFINTFECPADDRCKKEIIRVSSQELWESSTPSGLVRLSSGRGNVETTLNTKTDYIDGFRRGMLLGDLENAFICVSESAGGIHNIVSCEDVIKEVMAVQ